MANGQESGFNQMSVLVQFDPETKKVSFSGDDINSLGQIMVPQGMALIVFTLVPLSDPEKLMARFPSGPIQWVADDRSPITRPANFVLHRLSDFNITLQVMNTVLYQCEFPCFVVIQYGRDFYGSDPTIINLPPTGGTPHPRRPKPRPKR